MQRSMKFESFMAIDSLSGIFYSRKLDAIVCRISNFQILRDVILSLPNTNVPDLVTSIICIVFLHTGKWYINPFVRKRIIVPIPFELVAVSSFKIA